jgi:hypothetical protein
LVNKQAALACGVPRHIPYLYSLFLPCTGKRRPQNKGKRNIVIDTLIREAIVMFGINKVFRAKKGFSLLYSYGSSGMDRHNLPHRIFPEAKDVFPCKGQVIGLLLA